MRVLFTATVLELIEQSSHLSMILDPKTRTIVYASRAYESISGRDRGSLYESAISFLDTVHPEDREKARAMFERQMNYEVMSTEYRLVNPDGRVHWVRDRTFLIKESDAGDVHMGVMVEDITSLYERPRKLSYALGKREFALLSGGIAHDFNNVLTAVVGNGEMLLKDTALPTIAHARIETVVQAGLLGRSLAKELKEFSKPLKSERSIIDLNVLIRDFVPTLTEFVGRRIEVETSLARNIPMVAADADQLRRVVLNLVLNARDAMPNGGRLTLITCGAEAGDCGIQSHLHYGQAGRFAVLRVTDTGCGMDPITQTHIFEPFFRTKAGGVGNGLGLSIVKGIVRRHNGRVDVESIKDGGTTFSVYIPEASPEHPS